jgi:hypothetical protein
MAIILDFSYEWSFEWATLGRELLNNCFLGIVLIVLVMQARGRIALVISALIFTYYLVNHIIPYFS